MFNRTARRLLSLAVVAALLTLLSACDSDEIPTDVDPVERTAAELVEEADFLSTLEAAASESDASLLETLGRSEPLTVFAPGNTALDNWDVEGLLANPALLSDVIQYHVVDGSFTTSDLGEGQTLTSLQGTELSASASSVNGVGYFRIDQDVTNGTVHIVNNLLFSNRTIAERAEFFTPANAFYNALEQYELTAALNDPADDLTAFVPTEASLAGLAPLVQDQDLTDADVTEILQYHLLTESVTAGELVAALSENNDTFTAETVQGEDLVFTAVRAEPEEGEEQGELTGITINGGQASINLGNVDLGSTNGVSHLISGLLLPEAYRPDATETIASTSGLGTLSAALGATGLDATLGDRSAVFTVFAPSDDAFSAYDVDYLLANTDLLSEVLTYHVVGGQELAASALEEGALPTVQGDEITVSFGEEDAVFVNSAQVTQTDLPAVNGVVHVLDDVLLENQPVSLQLRALLATRTLYDNLANAELDGAVDGGDLTVFAPTNDAFEGSGFQGLTFNQRAEALQYHVLPSAVDSATLIDALEADDTFTTETLQGEDVVFTAERDDDGALTGITINDGQASIDLSNVDIEAESSFIHLIDGVLLPPSFTDDGDNA